MTKAKLTWSLRGLGRRHRPIFKAMRGGFRPDAERLESRVVLSGASATATLASAGPPTHAAIVASLAESAAPRLRSVTFGGSGFHAISSDPLAGIDGGESIVFAKRQWLDRNQDGSAVQPGDRREPVLYSGGSKLAVSASWSISAGQYRGDSILARGRGSNGVDIESVPVSRIGKSSASKLGTDLLSVTAAEAIAPFARLSQVYDHFVIQWELSFDQGKTWLAAGSSDNPLYVSASRPYADPNTGDLYLTVVDAAIRRTFGQSNPDAIIASTWQAFTTRDFKRYDGTPLHYYGATDPITNNLTVAALLRDGDGQCSTWAKMFLDMLLVNGIRQRKSYVIIEANKSRAFLVKGYAFDGGVQSGVAGYPYLRLPKQNAIDSSGRPHRIKAIDAVTRDITAPDMIAGQNSPDPASEFVNHQLVHIHGVYYDPSYGITAASLQDFTTRAIAGYSRYEPVLHLKASNLGIVLPPSVKSSHVRVARATVLADATSSGDTLIVSSRHHPVDYGFDQSQR